MKRHAYARIFQILNWYTITLLLKASFVLIVLEEKKRGTCVSWPTRRRVRQGDAPNPRVSVLHNILTWSLFHFPRTSQDTNFLLKNETELSKETKRNLSIKCMKPITYQFKFLQTANILVLVYMYNISCRDPRILTYLMNTWCNLHLKFKVRRK